MKLIDIQYKDGELLYEGVVIPLSLYGQIEIPEFNKFILPSRLKPDYHRYKTYYSYELIAAYIFAKLSNAKVLVIDEIYKWKENRIETECANELIEVGADKDCFTMLDIDSWSYTAEELIVNGDNIHIPKCNVNLTRNWSDEDIRWLYNIINEINPLIITSNNSWRMESMYKQLLKHLKPTILKGSNSCEINIHNEFNNLIDCALRNFYSFYLNYINNFEPTTKLDNPAVEILIAKAVNEMNLQLISEAYKTMSDNDQRYILTKLGFICT